MLETIMTTIIAAFAGGGFSTFFFYKYQKKTAKAKSSQEEATAESLDQDVEGKKIDNMEKLRAFYDNLFEDIKRIHAENSKTQSDKVELLEQKQELLETKMTELELTVSRAYGCENAANCPVIPLLKNSKKPTKPTT